MRNQYENDEDILQLIQEIEAGIFQRFGEFHICPKGDGRIEITAFLPDNIKLISDIQIENLETDLEKAKINFHEMVNKSRLFEEYISRKNLDYTLNYDYGGGSITVCSEIEGVFKIDLVD